MRCLALLLALLVSCPVHAEPPQAKVLGDRIADLLTEISTINLLNALNLGGKQMRQVLALARRAKFARDEGLEGSVRLKETLAQAEQDFLALRAEIQKGAPARGPIADRAAASERATREEYERRKKDVTRTIRTLEAELRLALSPEQAMVIDGFTPCLLPPDDLANPVRAGQARGGTALVGALMSMRSLPDDRWQEVIERRIADHVRRFSEHRCRLTEAEVQAEQARLLELARKVRGMSDVDFQMEKDTLAAQIQPEDRTKNLRQQLEDRSPHRETARSRLAEYLLDPRVIPILEERLGLADTDGTKQ